MLVLLALLLPASVASAKGCARGRFQLGDATGRAAAALDRVVLVFERGTVHLEGMCSAQDVGRSYYYGFWQYRTRLRLADACGDALARARMRIRFDYRDDCRTLTGKLRTRHGRTRFTAHRLPTCGNGRTEDGEACDDDNVDAGDCCDGGCQVEPGCTGSCDGPADCNPAALCIRDSVPLAGGCPSTRGRCAYEPPESRENLCPSNPPPNAPGVCGCDRRHYGDYCDAWAAGIAVAWTGWCPCDGVDGATCQDGYWCDHTTPQYGCAALRSGECIPLALDCEGVDASEVCGCDGVTYPSDCARQQAHVDLSGYGPCSLP
jgi:cysteine-rich repeat protein